jgi:hypothetical protein
MVNQTIPGIRVDGHTPGPWKIVRHTSGPDQALSPSDDWSIVGPNAESIVFEGAGRKVARETEANARLIAAAPELLEAVQNFLGLFDNAVYRRKLADDALYPDVIRHARAAIAKASPSPTFTEVGNG